MVSSKEGEDVVDGREPAPSLPSSGLPGPGHDPPHRADTGDLGRGFLDDDSRIVRTFAMQALADLAEHDEQMRRWVRPLLAELTRTGTPAMRSRGRTLLARLEQPGLSRRTGWRTRRWHDPRW